MNLIVDHSIVSTAVSDLQKVCATKSVIPILSGIKIEAEKGAIKLTGGNSEMFMEKMIPIEGNGEIIEEGSVVVVAKYLNELLKKFPGKIQLNASEKSTVIIKSGDITTKLNRLHVEQYPKLPAFQSSYNVKMTLGDLKEAIKQTLFAVSKSDSKPVLTGVQFEFQKGKLILTATDSNRLSRKMLQVHSEHMESIVVPDYCLNEILNIKEADASVIEIAHDRNLIAIKANHTTLLSVLIEGHYPDIRALIPNEFISRVKVNRKKLLAGVERACIFSGSSKHNDVNLRLCDGDSIKITSISTEIGMIEEYQKVHTEGETNFSITLDGRYLIEALKGIKEEEITMQFNGNMKPIVLKSENNPSYLQLISPRRAH